MKHFPLMLAGFCLPVSTLSAGVVFNDSFSGSGAPDAHWVTDSSGDSTANATLNVTAGALNLNTPSVDGLDPVRHTIELIGTGAPTLTLASDWTIETNATIGAGAGLETMAGGEGVALSFGVRNDLPSTSDRAQMNFVNLNFGSGQEFAVRGAHQTDGVETANIENFGVASAPLTVTMRLSYDFGTRMISFGVDTGSGFLEPVSAVDTSAWAMSTSDPLLLQLELGAANFSGDPFASTFSIEDGEATVNEYTISDEALATNTIPEPSSLLLGLLGMSGLMLRRRR